MSPWLLGFIFFVTICAQHFPEQEFRYTGFQREERTNELSQEDQTIIVDAMIELLKVENESFEKELITIKNIEQMVIYHATTFQDQKDYTKGYKRNAHGRIIGYEPYKFATEYEINFEFNLEKHFLKIWKDVDGKFFLTKHIWKKIENEEFHPLEDILSKTETKKTSNTTNTIEICSYNIWNFNGDWETRAEMIVEEVLRSKAAVIGFQEFRYSYVEELTAKQENRAKLRKRFQLDEMKEQFKNKESKDWQYEFQVAMTYLDNFHSDEGPAYFSKYPILETSYLLLSRVPEDPEDAHQRILHRALIETPIGNLTVFNTHFALQLAARERAVVEIWKWIQQFPQPQLLMGDLNAEPDDTSIEFLLGKKEIQGVTADFVDLCDKFTPSASPNTFPAWTPIKRIDFLLGRGINILNYQLLGQTPKYIDTHDSSQSLYSSDHFGISATISFNK